MSYEPKGKELGGNWALPLASLAGRHLYGVQA